MDGIHQSLSFLGREDEYSELIHRVYQRLMNNNQEFDPKKPISKNLLEKFGDETEAFEYWQVTLIECLKEEYPRVFEAYLEGEV